MGTGRTTIELNIIYQNNLKVRSVLSSTFILFKNYIFNSYTIDMQVQTTAKTNNITVSKYDRQIRLWGPRGQKRLGEAHVALVGCSGAGIQGLKNLVLPGVGHIDIWDDKELTVEDLSSSFFYEQQRVGQLRGKVASDNLLQMNPDDVQGSFYPKNIDQFLDDSESIRKYNLVIFGGGLSEEQTIKASQKLWELNVPCIFIAVTGFFFYVRSQKQINFVESSNTSAKKYFLRISNSFQELSRYAEANDIYHQLQKVEGKDVEEVRDQLVTISNIPYILVLNRVIERLPKDNRKRPAIEQELKALKDRIHHDYRENIDQALSRIFDAFQTPDNYMIDISLFENKNVLSCNKDSHLMVKFLYACQKFLSRTGLVPQPTSLPDMNTTTEKFISLKNIYKQKHESDINEIVSIIEGEFGGEGIDRSIISDYINNLGNLEVVEMRKYADELANPNKGDLKHYYLPNQEDLYLAQRSFLRVQPNAKNLSYQQFYAVAESFRIQFGLEKFDERFIKEAFRSKGRSDINMFSIAGAIVGQEAIKLISGCFTPMNGGYLFDGANGKGFQVKL